MRGLPRLAGLLALGCVSPGSVLAQTTTTGGILGAVRDERGQPVADALVTAASSQVTRITVTKGDGSYSLGLLNPGPWILKVTKAGMTAPSQEVLVYVDSRLTANFRMALNAAMEVTVMGNAELVDVTTTSLGQQMTLDQVAALPKSRDVTDLASFTAGVNADPVFSDPVVSGASGAENQYVLDGLATNDYRVGFQGTRMKTEFIDQLDVQTAGIKPEYSALGGVVIALTKSGSNQARGSAWATWDPTGMQSAPKQTFYAQEAPSDSRYDLGFELGGPLVKDRLFYFVGLDGQWSLGQRPAPNYDPGLVGSRPSTTESQVVAKLNGFLTPETQVTLFLDYWVQRFSQTHSYWLYGTEENGYVRPKRTFNASLSLDWTPTPAFYLSAKVGMADNWRRQEPTDTTTQVLSDAYYYVGGPGAIAHPEWAGLDYWSGGWGAYTLQNEGKSTQAKVDLSWSTGMHTVKGGLSWTDARYLSRSGISGPPNPLSSNGRYPLEYHVDSLQRFSTWEYHGDATLRTIYGAAYLQDTWEASPGLRLFYGARQEVQDLRDMDGRSFLRFNGLRYLQPRLGMVWDVSRDSRTKVSASYAVYYEAIPQLVSTCFANFVSIKRRWPATAYDYNNGDPIITDPAGFTRIWDYATPFTYDPIAEGTRLPQRKEFTAAVERTFASGWTLGLHAKWRRMIHIIEDSVLTDAQGNPYDSGAAITFDATGQPIAWGGQAILWNPGPHAAWIARDVATSLNPGQRFVVDQTLFPEAWNRYRALDITAVRKTARDYLSFSYTLSRLDGNYEGLVQNSNHQAAPNAGAAFDAYPYVGEGLLSLDRTHVVKLQASRRLAVLGRDLNLGFAYVYQSGTPLSRMDASNDILGYGGATFPGGKRGNHGRTPATHNLDLHADWVWPLLGKAKLSPTVDVFNAFNSRRPLEFDEVADRGDLGGPNPTYGLPTTWQQGRRWRFGVKVVW
ncbi:MAG TPA: TonB-dependent receptor [Geothrix sp.]|nr:TonB-dependent receptor [Geothrix sp.]